MKIRMSVVILWCLFMVLIFSAACVEPQQKEKRNISPELLRQKRAEVFKEMGWKEGVYASKKEEEIARKLTNYKDPAREYSLIDPDGMKIHKGDAQYTRPLVEFILDPSTSSEGRGVAIWYLGIIQDKRCIRIFKKIIDMNIDNDQLQIRLGDALYRLGEKEEAFTIYEKLIRKGVYVPGGFFNFGKDKDAKNVLLRVMRMDNPVMQALAINRLLNMGERELVLPVFENLWSMLKNGELKGEHPIIHDYLDWASKELKAE